MCSTENLQVFDIKTKGIICFVIFSKYFWQCFNFCFAFMWKSHRKPFYFFNRVQAFILCFILLKLFQTTDGSASRSVVSSPGINTGMCSWPSLMGCLIGYRFAHLSICLCFLCSLFKNNSSTPCTHFSSL